MKPQCDPGARHRVAIFLFVCLAIPCSAIAQPTRSVGFGSVATTPFSCYEPASYNTLCFAVRNDTPDGEWLDRVELEFPIQLGPWDVTCDSQDPMDSNGSPANLVCQIPSPNRVTYTDNDADGLGEIGPGASWSFCVEVWVPAPYNGPRIVNWALSGDGTGDPPHSTTGSVTIEPCGPLMLWPRSILADGCNALPTPVELELLNNSGGDATVDLAYSVTTLNGEALGPASLSLRDGEVLPFVVELLPERCVPVGQQLAAIVTASHGGYSDEVSIDLHASLTGGFQVRPGLPVATMDNVVAGAVHDGGLWSIAGYDSAGAVQRYDPESGLWTSHAVQPEPRIEYPIDGCYGLNSDGDEVVVLFPDTQGPFAQRCTDQGQLGCVMQRYNITRNVWDEPPVPTGYPPLGRWAQDVVSLYPITGENVCYLSGGATTDGSGQVNNLWEYRPDLNITIFRGNFTHHPAGFDFHASWFVPWVGSAGAICVAGGIDVSSVPFADSQCYDRSTQLFNSANADLGPLPQAWWGGANGWDVYEGRHRLWIADGVNSLGYLSGESAYADPTTGGFSPGPETGELASYRLGSGTLNGEFYLVGGSQGSFVTEHHVHVLARCPDRSPPHDRCTDAIEVGPGLHPGEFACAAADGSSTCTTGDVDVWYRFNSPMHGILHARTCGSHDQPAEDEGPDTVLSIHPDCSGAQYPGVCNDDWPSGPEPLACAGLDQGIAFDSAVPIPTIAGQDYLIRLARYDTDSALEYVLELELEVPAGVVPDGTTGSPLRLTKSSTDLFVSWSPSCLGDTDYAVYRGPIGSFDLHQPVTCDSPDPQLWQESLGGGSYYYLVAANNRFSEGSYGAGRSGGADWERPASTAACYPQSIGTCP